jgi:hypothetical protein
MTCSTLALDETASFAGAQCNMERRRYEDAIKWCDDALLVSFLATCKVSTVTQYLHFKFISAMIFLSLTGVESNSAHTKLEERGTLPT